MKMAINVPKVSNMQKTYFFLKAIEEKSRIQIRNPLVQIRIRISIKTSRIRNTNRFVCYLQSPCFNRNFFILFSGRGHEQRRYRE
jgi:hypothetical protein